VSDQPRWDDAWEFFFDSIAFLDETKYKSVSKYLITSWEEEMKKRGLVESIDANLEKIGSKNQMNVLIRFPWEGHNAVSLWFDDHKTRFEDLKENIKKCEQAAREQMRNHDEKRKLN